MSDIFDHYGDAIESYMALDGMGNWGDDNCPSIANDIKSMSDVDLISEAGRRSPRWGIKPHIINGIINYYQKWQKISPKQRNVLEKYLYQVL